MRIGIYNRWLHTLGGGEREAGAFAQVLQHDHAVELLVHRPIDLDLLAERLNLSLRAVALRTLPFDPAYLAVRRASADYDLFLNISHGDLFVPGARVNLLRVFFPTRGDEDDRDGRATAHDRGGRRLELLRGFYRPEADGAGPFAWTGPHAELLLYSGPSSWRLGRRRELHLLLHGWRPAGATPATIRVLVDGTLLGTRRLPPDGLWRSWGIPLPRELAQRETLRVIFETTTFRPCELGISDDFRELGVALSDVHLSERWWALPSPSRLRPEHGVADTAAYERMRARGIQTSARGYHRLLANSHFTQSWITRRWSLPSQVLYPPVDARSFPSISKHNVILSVGRFFEGSHNKRHLPMIGAFRALCDAGLCGWEYHLAGGCDEADGRQRSYLAAVRAAAEGYPIVVHANLPFARLQELYASASIFWHATGFGQDEERSPESFEHFGISTVEAMAAGCVPVVFGGGGQVEIVEHGANGYLWQSLAELQSQTKALIADANLRSRVGAVARVSSHAFDTAHFEQAVRALVADYS